MSTVRPASLIRRTGRFIWRTTRIGLCFLMAGLIFHAYYSTIKIRPPSMARQTHPPFPAVLGLCPGARVSNAPPTDYNLQIRDYAAVVRLAPAPAADQSGTPVILATAPVTGGCLISGFGPRRRSDGSTRPHRGIDIANPVTVSIFAGGDGKIIERKIRKDYGKMLLIDHGSGIYTRYAHLSEFSRRIKPGKRVKMGQIIGQMGQTGSAQGQHLHYEILSGNYHTPKASFGLEALDVFALPPAG